MLLNAVQGMEVVPVRRSDRFYCFSKDLQRQESATYVDGGVSARPTSIFHDSAVGAAQYSSGHGNRQLAVSALFTKGWLLNKAGY